MKTTKALARRIHALNEQDEAIAAENTLIRMAGVAAAKVPAGKKMRELADLVNRYLAQDVEVDRKTFVDPATNQILLHYRDIYFVAFVSAYTTNELLRDDLDNYTGPQPIARPA